MRVLVCGGRDFADERLFRRVLLNDLPDEPTLFIHGGAAGADEMCDRFARFVQVPVWCFPAQWDRYGRAAGPRRNAQMLAEAKPDLVVAFPGGHGTKDMVRRAKAAGVEVLEVQP